MAAGKKPAGKPGRPKKPKSEHRITISLSLPPATVEEIDRFADHYGSHSRSSMLLFAWNQFATTHPEKKLLANGHMPNRKAG